MRSVGMSQKQLTRMICCEELIVCAMVYPFWQAVVWDLFVRIFEAGIDDVFKVSISGWHSFDLLYRCPFMLTGNH